MDFFKYFLSEWQFKDIDLLLENRLTLHASKSTINSNAEICLTNSLTKKEAINWLTLENPKNFNTIIADCPLDLIFISVTSNLTDYPFTLKDIQILFQTCYEIVDASNELLISSDALPISKPNLHKGILVQLTSVQANTYTILVRKVDIENIILAYSYVAKLDFEKHPIFKTIQTLVVNRKILFSRFKIEFNNSTEVFGNGYSNFVFLKNQYLIRNWFDETGIACGIHTDMIYF